jgi:hypothetical protein
MLSACGGNGPTEPEKQDSTLVMAKEEKPQYVDMTYAQAFDSTADDKFVIIEGYLQLPGMMYTSGESGQLNFTDRAGQRYGEHITANVRMGNCNNCMTKLGEKYTLNDLKIKADDGSEILGNQRVKITGKLRVYDSSTSKSGVSVSIEPEKIERVPEVALDYNAMQAIKVDKTTLHDTTLDYEFTMAEGKLNIPSMLFMNEDVSLTLKTSAGEVSASFLFGTGSAQIENIPENYKNSDFKIHDASGKIIDLKKPVKVWGTRTPPKKDYGGIIYVEHIEQ